MKQIKTIFLKGGSPTLRTYNDIQEIAIGQGDDYTAGCLPDYNYFEIYYKMTATDLKAIQQISLTGNSKNNVVIFFIIEEAKETVLDFSQGTVKV